VYKTYTKVFNNIELMWIDTSSVYWWLLLVLLITGY